MKINESDKAAIKEKLDLILYLEKRGHNLTPAGGMSYKMLCPIHNERSPSFHVSEEYQNFHCFGCGAAGDIISFVMEVDKLSFVAAVQELAEEAGLKLSGVEEDPLATKRLRLRRMMKEVKEWYRQNFLNLPADHPGKQNFEGRNLLEQAMKDETVGWAPSGGLTNYLKQKNYTEEDMLDAGLLKQGDNRVYEAFRSRITWSLEDVQGNTNGFSARKILDSDTGPKYLNTSQTLLYNKSRTLLGLSQAKRHILDTQRVYIVEGQTDVMAMNAAGYLNTVASCGTAFGAQHAQMLMNLAQKSRSKKLFELVFCFDGDAAGIKAARKVFDENKEFHLYSSIVTFLTPDGAATDPCDYRKDFGNEKLQSLVNDTSVGIVEYVLRQEMKNWNIKTPEGQSQYIASVKQILSLVTDRIQYSSYVRKVAGWTGVPINEVERILTQPSKHFYSPPSNENAQGPRIVVPESDVPDNPYDDQEYLAEYYVEAAFDSDPTAVTPAPAPVVKAPLDQMELKMLSLIVKRPVETLEIMQSLGVDIDFFITAQDLARSIVTAVIESNLGDLISSNTTVSSLAYQQYDLGETDSEVVESITKIVKSFMRYMHSIKIADLNREMSHMLEDPSRDPVEVMSFMMEQQAAINATYLPSD